MNKSSNKRPVESFVVGSNTAVTIPTSGTLNNTSTGNVNLTTNQLGIVSYSPFGTTAMNSFCDATPTVAEAPVIGIVQGTAYSQNVGSANVPYPLWVQPYRTTAPINGANTVRVTKQNYRLDKHNIHVIGNTSGQANAINVASEATYSMNIYYSSRRSDALFSRQESTGLTVSKTTPDFTALGYSTAQAIDWLATNFAYDINLSSRVVRNSGRFASKAPIVALLVASNGGAGTAITSLTAGTNLPIVTTPTLGTRSLALTPALVASIQAAATTVSLPAGATIIPADLAGAGVATPAAADVILLVALDETQAYVDYIPETKVRLRVGLSGAFNAATVRKSEAVFADPGQGLGRVLNLMYQRTQGQREYFNRHSQDPVINFPSPVSDIERYVTYVVHHGREFEVGIDSLSYSPYKEIILLPAFLPDGVTANTLIATFDTAMNSWLGSAQNSNQLINLV